MTTLTAPLLRDAAFYVLAVFGSIGTFTGLSLAKLVRPQSRPASDASTVVIEAAASNVKQRLILKTSAGSYEFVVTTVGSPGANTSESTHEKSVIRTESNICTSLKSPNRDRGIEAAVVKRSTARWMRRR